MTMPLRRKEPRPKMPEAVNSSVPIALMKHLNVWNFINHLRGSLGCQLRLKKFLQQYISKLILTVCFHFFLTLSLEKAETAPNSELISSFVLL